MTKFRAFIATKITPTKSIKDLHLELQNSGTNIKLVEPKNLHITLRFLGDTNETLKPDIEQIIQQSIHTIQPFNITLQGLGVFPNQNYIKVLWIGLHKTEPLVQIAQNIEKQLPTIGFKPEKRPFSPHLTIGRVKTAQNKQNLLNIIDKHQQTEFGIQSVETIKLMKSDLTPKGPIYTILSETPLS